jgi:hypothetical protein
MRGAPAVLSGADGEAMEHEEVELSAFTEEEIAQLEQIVTSAAAQTAGQ